MADFKFELNRAGVKELLQSSDVSAMLAEEASAMVGRLPSGYGMSTGVTSQRAKATVYTEEFSAILDNSKNNSLLKAMGGGG